MIQLAILENNTVVRIAVCEKKDSQLAQDIANGMDFRWIKADEFVQIGYTLQGDQFIAPPIIEDQEALAEIARQKAEQEAKINAKMSAMQKLKLLGLSDEEIAALL